MTNDDFESPLTCNKEDIFNDLIEFEKKREKAPRYYDVSRFCKLLINLHNGDFPRVAPLYIKSNLDSFYESPSRFYHGVLHINQGLEEIDEIKHLLENPNELEIAWYSHDFVYSTKANNNEEESAEFICKLLYESAVSSDKISRVKRMIIATDHKTPPKNADEKYIVDIDLSIIGKDEEKYNWYSNGIRQEYSWVPEQQYKEGRSKILQGFLERPLLYYTDYFKDKYESQARKNLEREIRILRKI